MLWRSLERVIPDIRARAEVVQMGAHSPCCALMTALHPTPGLVWIFVLITTHAAVQAQLCFG